MRRFFYIVLVVFFVFGLISNFVIDFYIKSKSSKDVYIGKKESKYEHMRLQDNIYNKDYIFVGSSKTQFHISTDRFAKEGIDIYNYGASGAEMIDFGYMVEKAVEFGPKYIVISIEVDRLYQGTSLGDYININYDDFVVVAKTQGMDIVYESLINVIKNKYSINVYSTSIYTRLKQIYERFGINIKYNNVDKSISSDNQRVKYELDCRPFDYNKISKTQTVVKCSNGDGIIFMDKYNQGKLKRDEKELSIFDKSYIDYFNYILDKISSKGINSIVVLEPISNMEYSYDLDSIKSILHSDRVIDMTNMSTSSDMWSDTVHFNNLGRDRYSRSLVDILKD
jgi:hypothetical protein